MVLADAGMSSFYGLTRNSCLNQLEYFHVTRGLPFDVDHDLLEGVIPDVLGRVITHCTASGYFDLKRFEHSNTSVSI